MELHKRLVFGQIRWFTLDYRRWYISLFALFLSPKTARHHKLGTANPFLRRRTMFRLLTPTIDVIDSESIMYSNSQFWRLYLFWQSYYRCSHLLRLLHTRKELQELIEWANRKRLSGTVGRAYRRKLIEIEQQISALGMRSPQSARWAHVLYYLNRFVSIRQKHYRGYAARYRTV